MSALGFCKTFLSGLFFYFLSPSFYFSFFQLIPKIPGTLIYKPTSKVSSSRGSTSLSVLWALSPSGLTVGQKNALVKRTSKVWSEDQSFSAELDEAVLKTFDRENHGSNQVSPGVHEFSQAANSGTCIYGRGTKTLYLNRVKRKLWRC